MSQNLREEQRWAHCSPRHVIVVSWSLRSRETRGGGKEGVGKGKILVKKVATWMWNLEEWGTRRPTSENGCIRTHECKHSLSERSVVILHCGVIIFPDNLFTVSPHRPTANNSVMFWQTGLFFGASIMESVQVVVARMTSTEEKTFTLHTFFSLTVLSVT